MAATHPAGLLIRPSFLDPVVREAIARVIDADSGEPAAVLSRGAGRLAVDSGVRQAWEVSLPEDLQERLVQRIESIRPEFEAHFGVPLAPCDAVAALRYPAGAYYRPHRDTSDNPGDLLHWRVASVVIFLNYDEESQLAEYSGGRLRLYGPMSDPLDTPVDVTSDAGTLVSFPSDWLHEVTPVERGERRTLVTWLTHAAARA